MELHGLGVLQQMLPYLIPIILIELVLLVVALVDLIRSPGTRSGPKWMWAIVIIFFQIIGPIIYFVVGRKEE